MSQSPAASEKIKILLFDFYNANEPNFSYLHRDVIDLQRDEAYEVQITNHLDANVLQDPETHYDIYLMWLDSTCAEDWKQVIDALTDKLHYAELIVIFGFDQQVETHAREVMEHGAFSFACPFNINVLKAYIDAEAQKIDRQRRLDVFSDRLSELDDLQDFIRASFDYLKDHPMIGYDRATFMLIDPRDGKRYFISHKPNVVNPNRHLLAPIKEDPLIQRVFNDRNEILILKNIQLLREEYYRICYPIRNTYKRLRDELLPKLDRTLFEVGERGLVIEKIKAVRDILSSLRESQIEDWQRENRQAIPTADPSLQWRQISSLKLVHLNELETALRALIEALNPLREKITHPEHQTEFKAHLETLEEWLPQLTQLKAQGWTDTPTTEGINSWIGIGLRHDDQAIGLIVLDHYTPNHYGRFGEI